MKIIKKLLTKAFLNVNHQLNLKKGEGLNDDEINGLVKNIIMYMAPVAVFGATPLIGPYLTLITLLPITKKVKKVIDEKYKEHIKKGGDTFDPKKFEDALNKELESMGIKVP